MQQKIVNLIRENELFDMHVTFAKAGDKVNGLREVYVAIVVAMNKEHRRFPGVNGSDGRRLVREFSKLRRNILAVPVVGGPIVYSVEIDTSGKKVRVAREPQSSEVAPVTATPQANVRGVYAGARLQIFGSGDDVLILAGSASSAAGRFAEPAAVADSAAIVYRQHHVAAACEVLVHG